MALLSISSRDKVLQGRVDEPKGDPGNTLSREEIESKAIRLATYSHSATEAEMRAVIAKLWAVEKAPRMETWLT